MRIPAVVCFCSPIFFLFVGLVLNSYHSSGGGGRYGGGPAVKCQAHDTDCGNRPISDVVGGQRVKSLYCEYHHCHMVENGAMCRVAKPPRSERYCKEREYIPSPPLLSVQDPSLLLSIKGFFFS